MFDGRADRLRFAQDSSQGGQSEIELSVVMPCLNEAETLEVCIKKAQRAISEHGINAEIIVADNGSNDGSHDIARRNGARLISIKEKGYGSALRGGISAAKGKYVIMGDADDSYDFGEIFRFVEKLRLGYDLVMGCRLPKGGGVIMPGAMPLKHRLLGNPVLSWVGRIFFKSPMTDFHCGLRGFSKAAFEAMELHTTGMEFASEMVIKATLLKLPMAEIPITLHRDGRSRPPHLRSWRDGWRHLRFMLMYSPRWLFFFPGGLFLVLGAMVFLRLMMGPIFIGHIGLESNTILVAGMSMLIGFQMISFYLFAKVFAITEGLLPEDAKINMFLRIFPLEVGILIGIAFFGLGTSLLAQAFILWAQTGYGELAYLVKLKKVIPATIFLLFSFQVIFSSFFLSILKLHRK